jgi:hypothetical protein
VKRHFKLVCNVMLTTNVGGKLVSRLITLFIFFMQSGGGGGYVTDEELELCQTLEDQTSPHHLPPLSASEAVEAVEALAPTEDIQSPSKEVLIADNCSRR